MRVRFTPASQWDIGVIYAAIAPNNPIAAQQVEDYIRRTAAELGEFPLVGASTNVEGVRRLPLVRYPYTVFYRVADNGNGIEILRVVHSSRVKNLRQVPD